MDTVNIEQKLNELLEKRTHGAVNIGGIRFQLAYSVLRSFDLYNPNLPDIIQLEGIEDLDHRGGKEWRLKGFKFSNQFVQVKTSGAPWDLGRFTGSGIIENFL